LGLVTKRRNFSKVAGNVTVNLTGAEIQGQQSHPDISDPTIYIDGEETPGDAGTVIADAGTDEVVQLTGAESAAEAGTATVGLDTPANVTGAESSAQAGEATVITGDFAVGQPLGVEVAAEAGTVTVEAGVNASIIGAVGTMQPGTEIGIDTEFDLSVTVNGAEISGEAGTVSFVETFPGPIIPLFFAPVLMVDEAFITTIIQSTEVYSTVMVQDDHFATSPIGGDSFAVVRMET
jgi:hypothetical protein